MIREILEKYFNSTQGARKEWELAAQGDLPIPPQLMKEFERDIKEVYHACSINSLKRVIKNQNKKVQISAFSKGSSGIAQGAIQTSEVLIILKGKTVFGAGKDMGNVTDRNGYKWLGRYSGKNNWLEATFTFPMFEKMQEYFNVNVSNYNNLYDTAASLDGKGKAKFIKWYFDESKKFLTRSNLKKIKKDLEDDLLNSKFDNDEIILHDFKITNIYAIDDGSGFIGDRIEKLKNLKIPISGKMSTNRVADLGRGF